MSPLSAILTLSFLSITILMMCFQREYSKGTDNLYRDNIPDNITENVGIPILCMMGGIVNILFSMGISTESESREILWKNITFVITILLGV